MTSITPEDEQAALRRARRLTNTVKDSLRAAGLELALLNHQVSARLSLRDVDFDCLNLLNRHGALGPGALARLAGLHPATMTGVVDRLEREGWVVRERDPEDRRAVRIRPLKDRSAEVFKLYAGMSSAMDDICAGYTADELALIGDFLTRVTAAGRTAGEALAD